MEYILKIVRGMIIGIANAIPGVSGGTMMVSMGIYDDIIGSINNLFADIKKSIFTLLPYIVGMGVGVVGLSYGIEYFLTNYSLQTSMIFIGLILGGLPVMLEKVKGKKLGGSNILVFLLFFGLVIGLQIIGGGDDAGNVLTPSIMETVKLFGIGIIAAATMVIPGVSGSMILMLLGYYYPVITTITTFIDGVFAFNMANILYSFAILAPFGLGVVVGIFAIAKLIEMLLNNHETITYCGILGLVIASPIVVLMSNGIPALSVGVVVSSAITFVIGFAIAYFLGRE